MALMSADDYLLEKQTISTQYSGGNIRRYMYGSGNAALPAFRYHPHDRRAAPAGFRPDAWQLAPVDVYMLLDKVVRFLRAEPRTNAIAVYYNQHLVTYDVVFVPRRNLFAVRAVGATEARRSVALLVPEELLRVLFALLYLTRYDAHAAVRQLRAMGGTVQHYTQTGVTWDDKYWAWKMHDRPVGRASTQPGELGALLPRSGLIGEDPSIDVCFLTRRDLTNIPWRDDAPRMKLQTVQSHSVRSEPFGLYEMIREQTNRYNYFPLTPRESALHAYTDAPDLVHSTFLEHHVTTRSAA